MHIHQLRNATLVLTLGDRRFAVDPMLSEVGAMPGFRLFAKDRKRNPLVPLPPGSDEALARRGLRPRALVLVGDPHPSNRETLARMGRVARLYEVPRLDPLDGEALDAWIDEHDVTELFKA